MRQDWQQVKQIFATALVQTPETRAEYISNECHGDLELQHEVESLISSHDSAAIFLESPAVYEVAETFSESTQTLNPGEFVKHYRITKHIATGGMGEVYLADDTKLERNVAVKILNENFESGQSNLSRFFAEGKAVSALAHPNILVIHEIGEYEGTYYIVSEFVEGETLGKMIKKSDYALIQVIDIAIQVARGLAAAHKAGIVHRDIKPDNIILRGDGIIKVLDFGLVKRIGKQDPLIDYNAQTQELINTKAGMVLGTAAYMSPEQARGKPVDTRTDIWSLGVVLFQMLSKQLPFPGETTSDIIASILKNEPPSLEKLAPSIPCKLVAIIEKTLEKDADRRYQGAEELLIDLGRVRRSLENDTEAKTEPLQFRVNGNRKGTKKTDGNYISVTVDEVPGESAEHQSFFSTAYTSARSHPNILALILVGFSVLLIASYYGVSRFRPNDNANSFQNMELKKLTSEGNAGEWAAVSPDGKYIAYVVKTENRESLAVRQVESSGLVEIVPPGNVRFASVAFAPDGNNIFYNVYEKPESGTIYEIPVLGGEKRKVVDRVDDWIAVSPDGKNVAFTRGRKSLLTSPVKGGSERTVTSTKATEAFLYLSWSANGKSIFASLLSSSDPNNYLVEIDVDTGAETWRSETAWKRINGLTSLSDGTGIIISGRDPKSTRMQLWFVPYPTGAARRITNDLSNYFGISLTANNEALVSVKHERTSNLWIANEFEGNNAEQLSLGEGKDAGLMGISSSPDHTIVYTARDVGNFDIWSARADGANKRQLTSEQGTNISPVVSPDGKTIVFISDRKSGADLWRMDIDGSNLKQLTHTNDQEGFPSITPDGKYIVYNLVVAKDKATIWKMGFDGGKPIQLTTMDTGRPIVSPDGKFFACDYGLGENMKVAIFPIEGGKPVKLLDAKAFLDANTYRWASNGQALIYHDTRDHADNLWSQPIDGSAPKQLTFFESEEIYRFDISRDGNGFIVARGNTSSDVVLISNYR